jgi:hypothetical protein
LIKNILIKYKKRKMMPIFIILLEQSSFPSKYPGIHPQSGGGYLNRPLQEVQFEGKREQNLH